jgi:hypothetical protein
VVAGHGDDRVLREVEQPGEISGKDVLYLTADELQGKFGVGSAAKSRRILDDLQRLDATGVRAGALWPRGLLAADAEWPQLVDALLAASDPGPLASVPRALELARAIEGRRARVSERGRGTDGSALVPAASVATILAAIASLVRRALPGPASRLPSAATSPAFLKKRQMLRSTWQLASRKVVAVDVGLL